MYLKYAEVPSPYQLYTFGQLMVNCLFGAFGGLGFEPGALKNPNPFHLKIPGVQTTGPRTNN